jgi:cytochrome c-type biogenesis protein CcmH
VLRTDDPGAATSAFPSGGPAQGGADPGGGRGTDPTPGGTRERRWGGWAVGAVLAVAVIVALLVGAGTFTSTPPTPARRAAAIESTIRCPSCQDLSVAQSTAPTAVTVRATVTELIARGRTDDQIRAYLVDRYGATIDLEPPTSGWSALVWIVPMVGLAVALLVAAIVLGRRRRGRDGLGAPGTLAAVAADPVTAADTRRFLEASLADADAEFAAGDLDEVDYHSLRARDEARLSTLDRLAGPPTATGVVIPTSSARRTEVGGLPGARPAGRGRRRLFLAAAVAAFAGALVLVVALSVSNRQPGQSVTGSFAQSEQQQLAETFDQAATEVDQGDDTDAAKLYQSVLTAHPDNEVALAQLGWIEVQVGRAGGSGSSSLVGDGRAKLVRAVALDPADPAAHLYLGTTELLVDGDAAGAVAQYRKFLADDPPASLVRQAAPTIRQAFQKAGIPVPARVAG